jgi:sulfotransferase family protein
LRPFHNTGSRPIAQFYADKIASVTFNFEPIFSCVGLLQLQLYGYEVTQSFHWRIFVKNQWLVSGVGRSGTSFVYRTLQEVALQQDSTFSFFYEPYLWGPKVWRRRPSQWETDFGTTSAIHSAGLAAHLQTPLFLNEASHEAHDQFADDMFRHNQNVLAKIIRGAGRLPYYLKRYPQLKIIHVIRNPLDCINSALGLFSFFGDEFHPSDKLRFLDSIRDRKAIARTEAELSALWWDKMNESSLKIAKSEPDRVFILPHEICTTNPDQAYKALLKFLNINDSSLGDIRFSDPAGPITKNRNLRARDIDAIIDKHNNYFQMLSSISSAPINFDIQDFKYRIRNKYSNLEGGVFTPAIRRDATALVLRNRIISTNNKLHRQRHAKEAQIARLQLKIEEKKDLGRKINLLTNELKAVQKSLASKKHALTHAKADIFSQNIQALQREGEFNTLLKNMSKLQMENSKLTDQLGRLEYILAPRIMTLLKLRPSRYILAQRRKKKLQSRNRLPTENTGSDLIFQDSFSGQESLTGESYPHTKSIYESYTAAKPLGIAVFAYDRFEYLEHVLKSLKQQGALDNTHVWIDGDQGRTVKKLQIDKVEELANSFPVKTIHRNRSNFGFRKMMLIAMREMMEKYDRILFLEDDCFPTRHALNGFSSELDLIEENETMFSVYGHPFLAPNEEGGFGRFQGWGWATTKRKLAPIWEQLLECYLMSEESYTEFVRKNMDDSIKAHIDVTPGRQPSDTLSKFFAWDETICLLTAKKGLLHKRTTERLIYNFGAGRDSTHFDNIDYYREPPFNMISPSEVWRYY